MEAKDKARLLRSLNEALRLFRHAWHIHPGDSQRLEDRVDLRGFLRFKWWRMAHVNRCESGPIQSAQCWAVQYGHASAHAQSGAKVRSSIMFNLMFALLLVGGESFRRHQCLSMASSVVSLLIFAFIRIQVTQSDPRWPDDKIARHVDIIGHQHCKEVLDLCLFRSSYCDRSFVCFKLWIVFPCQMRCAFTAAHI